MSPQVAQLWGVGTREDHLFLSGNLRSGQVGQPCDWQVPGGQSLALPVQDWAAPSSWAGPAGFTVGQLVYFLALLWSSRRCYIVGSQLISEGLDLSGPDTFRREGHLPLLCLPTDLPSSSQPQSSLGRPCPSSPLSLVAPIHTSSCHPVCCESHLSCACSDLLAPRSVSL